MLRLDIIIFGATGFTGMKTVEETVKLAKNRANLTWGVAGRSQQKLDDLMMKISKRTGHDLSNISKIIADISDEKSLRAMCSRCNVLINCCGPYKLYGEPVVKAAIDSLTNYVDVTGEPEFMADMQQRYNQLASEAGVYVVTACGFDCIPNDVGVAYLQKNFKGTLNSVESYMAVWFNSSLGYQGFRKGVLHNGTWESMIHVMANSSTLFAKRRKIKYSLTPKLKSRQFVHRNHGHWGTPFLGTDDLVVDRTQRFNYEVNNTRPVQFKVYIRFDNFFFLILYGLFLGIVFCLTKLSFTRSLLIKYPRFFSCGMFTHGEIDEEIMDHTCYEVMLYGEGWSEGTDVKTSKPNKRMAVKVSGTNPGYGFTVSALLLSALIILEEKEKIPGSGGVLTTGAAFGDTSLVKRLTEHNVTFEIAS